jgi:hypothetical protein
MIPVLLRMLRDPAHRDALRAADGANLGHEAATTIAWCILGVMLAAVLFAVAASGC